MLPSEIREAPSGEEMRIWCRVNKKRVFCCNSLLSVINFLMRCRILRTDWSYRLIIIHEKLKDTSYRELSALKKN